MKKEGILLLLAIAFGGILSAQEKNIFLDRGFWKSNPSIETIEQKISEGHSATALSSNGFDAVTNAIFAKSSMEVIKHLLKKDGNSVNKLTHDKRTYVFWAAYSGDLELVKYLIGQGARLDLEDSHGFSPLTFAAVAGQTNTEFYDLFIANGIDITNDFDEHGANALLLIASKSADFKLIDYFVSKGLSLKSVDHHGNGVFNYAAKGGNKEILAQLIDKGVPYKELTSHNGNAMLAACSWSRKGYNSLAFFKYLESLGIQAKVTDKDGVTPLHKLAYGNKDLETIQYFIKKGNDANQVDHQGNTALINASSRNTQEVISLLTDKTKDINHANKKGQTALTNSLRNSPEVIRLLLSKGANIQVVDEKGNNMAHYLMKTYRPGNQEVFKQKMKILSENGFDLKTAQKNGNTLFHLAVEFNDTDLLKMVYELGIDVNQKNKDGLTPLHLAAMYAKNQKTMDYLLSIGADKSIKTDFDESVFELAKENELLKNSNVDINYLR